VQTKCYTCTIYVNIDLFLNGIHINIINHCAYPSFIIDLYKVMCYVCQYL